MDMGLTVGMVFYEPRRHGVPVAHLVVDAAADGVACLDLELRVPWTRRIPVPATAPELAVLRDTGALTEYEYEVAARQVGHHGWTTPAGRGARLIAAATASGGSNALRDTLADLRAWAQEQGIDFNEAVWDSLVTSNEVASSDLGPPDV